LALHIMLYELLGLKDISRLQRLVFLGFVFLLQLQLQALRDCVVGTSRLHTSLGMVHQVRTAKGKDVQRSLFILRARTISYLKHRKPRGKKASRPLAFESWSAVCCTLSEVLAMGRHGNGADEEAEQGNQQENPGEETTRSTPATFAGQSSARGTATATHPTPATPAGQSSATTTPGIAPSPQEVLATGRTNTHESSEGEETKIDDEETQEQQRSSISRLSSYAPVGATCTFPTDPRSRQQGYRLSTERHPDQPHLFYADGRGRRK
ncbi:hypothetical protein THAOC_29908, partial [Thalassiosira oceanica]